MRAFVGQLMIAAVLLILGFACWTAGSVEQRVADAHEQMALLHYGALDAAYDDVEESMGYARRVPWLTESVMKLTNVDEQRAVAEYWQARYAGLAAQQDPNGAAADDKPEVKALAANAAYRTGQREAGDRQDTLHKLDVAVKSYADLLKNGAYDADAAYNYEYILRMRDSVSKGRQVGAPKRPVQKSTGVVMIGDLPEGRTIHGDPGAPPPAVDAAQFKLVIPKREDERGPGDKAGDGKLKVRRG